MSKAKIPGTRGTAQGNKDTPDAPDVQGEGNYDATRRYDKAASDFAKSLAALS